VPVPRVSVGQLTTVDTLTAVRGLGITCVVINHAFGDSLLFHGGLNVLLFVSGINMASFAFNGTTRDTLKSFRTFTLRLVIPSILLALAWSLAVHFMATTDVPIAWSELLLFSNWITPERVSLFPIWYVQVIFQLMIVMALLFWMFDLTPRIQRAPVASALIALALSLAIAITSLSLWDTDYLANKLPQLLAWNFILGWAYWALAIRKRITVQGRLFLCILLLVCEILIFEIFAPFDGDIRIYSLTTLGFLLIWTDVVKLPWLLARAIILISQATFYVFLFHYYAFWVVYRAGKAIGLGELMDTSWVRVAAGLILPVFLWMVVTSARRAYRKTKGGQQSLQPAYSAI